MASPGLGVRGRPAPAPFPPSLPLRHVRVSCQAKRSERMAQGLLGSPSRGTSVCQRSKGHPASAPPAIAGSPPGDGAGAGSPAAGRAVAVGGIHPTIAASSRRGVCAAGRPRVCENSLKSTLPPPPPPSPNPLVPREVAHLGAVSFGIPAVSTARRTQAHWKPSTENRSGVHSPVCGCYPPREVSC